VYFIYCISYYSEAEKERLRKIKEEAEEKERRELMLKLAEEVN
jgi:hypothetical protein